MGVLYYIHRGVNTYDSMKIRSQNSQNAIFGFSDNDGRRQRNERDGRTTVSIQ